MASEPGNLTINVIAPSNENDATSQNDYALNFKAEPQNAEYIFSQQAKDFYSHIEIQAPHFEAETRPSVDVVAVLDVSGSMQGDKISLVRKSMRRLIRSLSTKDRVAFVTFDDHVNVLMNFCALTEQNKERAMDLIKNLKAGSRTALCGGVVEGIKQLLKNRVNDVAAVLLFTDGEANVGISDTHGIVNQVLKITNQPRFTTSILDKDLESWTVVEVWSWLQKIKLGMYGQQFRENQIDGSILKHDLTEAILQEELGVKRLHLAKFMRELEKLRNQGQKEGQVGTTKKKKNSNQASGFRLHTFGYGAGHNQSLLNALAESFDGMYHFVEDEEKIKEAFASCLGGLLSTVAQEIEMKIQFNPEVTNPKIHKDTGLTEENGIYTVKFADLQSEEKRNVLISCNLPIQNAPDENYLLYEVNFEYLNAIANATSSGVFQCNVNRSNQIAQFNNKVDETKNRVLTANALKEAARLGDNNDLEGCRKLLTVTMESVNKSPSVYTPECQSMQQDLRSALDMARNSVTYQNQGSAFMIQNMTCMTQQRCCNFSDNYSTQMLYSGDHRNVIRSNWESKDECDTDEEID
jgi:hypothetical protein